MHWQIASDGHVRNGLQVIEEVPDHRLCLIEGANGVGKSVAVQLFELISGSVPAALSAPPVWESFKGNLGHTAVEIQNMAGGTTARVQFTPEHWPTAPAETVTDDFGIVTIDDQPATMSRLAELLEVTTIRGDESLQDTVRGHIEQVEADLNHTTSTVRDRANETDEFIAEFSSDWVRADPSMVGTHNTRLEELTSDLEAAQARLREAERTAADLDRALEIGRKLSSADADVQSLLQQQATLKQQVAEYTATISTLEEDAEAAEATLAAQGGSSAQLSAAEKKLRMRQTRRSTQVRELAQLTVRNDLPADLSVVVDALKDARTVYTRLSKEIDSIDRGRRTQDALKRLIPFLDATGVARSEDVLMVIDDGQYTGTQVRDGFSRRSKEISDSPQPDEAVATLKEMEAIKRRLTALTAFKDAIDNLQRTDELVTEAETELRQAQKKSAGATKAAATLRDIHEQLATAQGNLTAAHQKSVVLQEQIGLSGVSSATEARAALTALLSTLGLDESELDTAQTTAARNFRTAADDVEHIREAMTVTQRSADESLTHISTLIAEVSSSPSYAWLRKSLSPQQLDDVADDNLQTFAVVRDVVLNASEAVFDAVKELEGLARLAHLLAGSKLSKSDAAQLEQPLGAPMARALGESLRLALNTDSIRTRVFGGLSVIRLDLQGQVIVLAGDGREERRAMSAFSTGERAFAFTQARIKDLVPSPKPNRLLVLDEFGAFISADRMSDLRDFLDTLEDIADQILIILPLQVDYEKELEDTRGQLRIRYEERIRQLAARSYSAVPL